MIEHAFTQTIKTALTECFGPASEDVLQASPLLQYLNIKTRSASRGSKSRASFGNLYALYVVVEDYVNRGYEETDYSAYEGARFADLMKRQRELPFGDKLQNHALNHRLNQEFAKCFPNVEYSPIVRDLATRRYWVNESLLVISVGGTEHNIARAILRIVDLYIEARTDAFYSFIRECEAIQAIAGAEPNEALRFLTALLRPNVDARVFEIVSYAILKAYYADQSIFWGWTLEDIDEDNLVLYKTGRTNANDGGIDFVMTPLGRFFQVTETVEAGKYFLDIDKVERYPFTFVVKTGDKEEEVLARLEAYARRQYGADKIVEKYMSCVEEIINIPILTERLVLAVGNGRIADVIAEVVLQSRVEFHMDEEEQDEE
jgi:hypothetical protein